MRAIDPIDRTELLKKAMPKNPDAEFHCVSVKDIMAMPSAEPEIVRCKDCLLYDTHGHRCKHWNHGVVVMDYCSRADRRQDAIS